MDIQIFQYKESHLDDIRVILNEYLSFIAKELIRPPWNFNLDIEHEVNFTMNNLDKFAEPDGRLLLVEVDSEIAGTISLRKIRIDAAEIKRMYVKPKFRCKKFNISKAATGVKVLISLIFDVNIKIKKYANAHKLLYNFDLISLLNKNIKNNIKVITFPKYNI